jgi:hypothetical protein
MTSSGKRPRPLKAAEVRKAVLAALSVGTYKESLHATFDHLERKISFADVIHGLKQPWASCKPDEFNYDEWQWKYEIKTTDIEGEALTIIVALDPKNAWFEVVTRYP